jgi:hypothetical protein
MSVVEVVRSWGTGIDINESRAWLSSVRHMAIVAFSFRSATWIECRTNSCTYKVRTQLSLTVFSSFWRDLAEISNEQETCSTSASFTRKVL